MLAYWYRCCVDWPLSIVFTSEYCNFYFLNFLYASVHFSVALAIVDKTLSPDDVWPEIRKKLFAVGSH